MIPFGRQKKSIMLVLCLLFMAVTATNPKPLPIILHFDINKSAAMVDPGQKKTVKDIINAAMAEAAYCPGDGYWENNQYDKNKGCDYPVYDKSELPANSEAYFGSYQGSLKRKVDAGEIKKKGEEGSMDSLIQKFTEDGRPGALLREQFKKLEEAMTLRTYDADSNADSDAEVASDAASEPKKKAYKHSERYYTLLPSFFKLLYQVAVLEKRDVSLIFRTFSGDAPDIVKDLNKFCRGQHPVFQQEGFEKMLQNENFTATMEKFILEPEHTQYAVSVRSADHPQGIVFGLNQEQFVNYNQNQEGGKLVEGYKQIYEEITTMCGESKKPKTAVIKSSYKYWGEDASRGKMFVVNPAKVIQVFFDDGVQKMLEDTYIIDSQHFDGNGISYREGNDIYFARVEPMEAIGDVNYYVNKFNTMRRRQGDRIIYRARLTRIITTGMWPVRGNKLTRTTTFSPYAGKGLITFGGWGKKRKFRLTNETEVKKDTITVRHKLVMKKDVKIITITGLTEGRKNKEAQISFATPTEQSAIELIKAIRAKSALLRKESQAGNGRAGN